MKKSGKLQKIVITAVATATVFGTINLGNIYADTKNMDMDDYQIVGLSYTGLSKSESNINDGIDFNSFYDKLVEEKVITQAEANKLKEADEKLSKLRESLDELSKLFNMQSELFEKFETEENDKQLKDTCDQIEEISSQIDDINRQIKEIYGTVSDIENKIKVSFYNELVEQKVITQAEANKLIETDEELDKLDDERDKLIGEQSKLFHERDKLYRIYKTEDNEKKLNEIDKQIKDIGKQIISMDKPIHDVISQEGEIRVTVSDIEIKIKASFYNELVEQKAITQAEANKLKEANEKIDKLLESEWELHKKAYKLNEERNKILEDYEIEDNKKQLEEIEKQLEEIEKQREDMYMQKSEIYESYPNIKDKIIRASWYDELIEQKVITQAEADKIKEAYEKEREISDSIYKLREKKVLTEEDEAQINDYNKQRDELFELYIRPIQDFGKRFQGRFSTYSLFY